MKFSEARQGRIFVLRFEDGDVIHKEIEKFARRQSVSAAAVIILGGADQGSTLMVGPEEGDDVRPGMTIMSEVLAGVHETAGTGTLFPDETGTPVLHMHLACGRESSTVTGCIRNGVAVWRYMEAILFELVDTTALRVTDPETGFKMLKP